VKFPLILLMATAALCAQSAPNWESWQFLIGDWVGEGTGQPGQGTGSFTFELQLDRRILVRKNLASYPATKDKPAYSHQDLMIVYPEGTHWRADYFDNEGHAIHYAVEFPTEGGGVSFISDGKPSEPRYLLAYTKAGAKTVKITFEVAPPGKPFARYIEAVARRK
jgi:hypothetical protein